MFLKNEQYDEDMDMLSHQDVISHQDVTGHQDMLICGWVRKVLADTQLIVYFGIVNLAVLTRC